MSTRSSPRSTSTTTATTKDTLNNNSNEEKLNALKSMRASLEALDGVLEKMGIYKSE